MALILTKPIGLVRSDARDKHLAHLLQSHYPAAAEGLRRRAWRYNTAVQRAQELEQQGLVCIIAPDSTEGMSTLTKNRAGLEKMYAKGKQDAEAPVSYTHLDVYKRQVLPRSPRSTSVYPALCI